MTTFKLHPVAAHFPGGLLPTAAFLWGLFIVFDNPGFEAAAFWLVMIATAVVPVSIGSGLYDWKKYHAGQKATIFYKKIGLAITLLILGAAATILRYGQPASIADGGGRYGLYLIAVLGMLGCVTLLGHYGAILVIQGIEKTLATEKFQAPAGEWSRAIVAQAPDAILAADREGIIRLWNFGAERIFGRPASEAVGQSLDLIIPKNLRGRHWEGWGKVMRTGTSRYGAAELLRVPALRADGSRFSAEFSIVILRDEAGVTTGVAAVLRDVTEQREREKQIKSQLDDCLTKVKN